jgi:tRNA (guanine-N7-)-methyltransferase
VRKGPRLPLEALQPYLLPTPPPGPALQPPPARLDWREVFGNDNPVEVEVGFGKGLHLVTAGAANPDINYLGIEIVRKYQLFAATRLARRQLRNVRVACVDARPFLRDWVSDGSVRAVHLYFPDPWWKTRHHKRRVFTPEFAITCERLLRPGGHLLVVTDVADYAEMVRGAVREHTRLAEAEAPAEHQPGHDMDYLTHFERKFRQEGRPIHRMRFVKPADSPGGPAAQSVS